MNIPKDPFVLLSFVNTKLRDEYSSLEKLCKDLQIDKSSLISTLESINYYYNSETNSFC